MQGKLAKLMRSKIILYLMVRIENIYDNAISVRNLEIDQFWKRNVFLFGIEGVILSFFIASFESLIDTKYNIILALLKP